MVNVPYAAPDPRLPIKTVTDRLYRGPCRTLDELTRVVQPFRDKRSQMFAAIDTTEGLAPMHRRDLRSYLESFFDRIETPQWVKRSFIDGCPADRQRI
jgi:hypothetical protein